MSSELEERCPPSHAVAAGRLRSAFAIRTWPQGFGSSEENPHGLLSQQQISGSRVLLKFGGLAGFSESVVHLTWAEAA